MRTGMGSSTATRSLGAALAAGSLAAGSLAAGSLAAAEGLSPPPPQAESTIATTPIAAIHGFRLMPESRLDVILLLLRDVVSTDLIHGSGSADGRIGWQQRRPSVR